MRKQKLFRRVLALLLTVVMVLGNTAVTATGEVSAGMSNENAGVEQLLEETVNQEAENSDSLKEPAQLQSPEAMAATGPAIMLGALMPDYQINEDVYNWTDGEQTVTLSGNDILTILNAPSGSAKITIDVASDTGSSVKITGDASTTYNNVRISVQKDINLTLENLKIIAPDTFGGFDSYPALNWSSSGGNAKLTVIGECSLTGSMFSSGISSQSDQKLIITGSGSGNDRLIAQGTSYNIPVANTGQAVGHGIRMLGLTGEGAQLTIEGVTVEAKGGNCLGSSGTSGDGIFVLYGNINIVNSTVTVANGSDSHPTFTGAAIIAGGNSNGGGDLTIENSTVTITGAENTGAVGDAGISVSRKVSIISGTVYVRAGKSGTNKGGSAINAPEVQISGGTVTAIGGNSTDEEGGKAFYIWPGTLSLSGGTVTATAGESENHSGGIAIYTGTLQLSGGTLAATGGRGALNGGHGIFVASGTATIETGTNLTAVGGNGNTGVGGVGLRAYGLGPGNTVKIANSAGDIYIRGGQGSAVQRPSVIGSEVYIGTGNVGDMAKEGSSDALSIKNTLGGDDVYKVRVNTDPATEAIIRCLVATPSEYTYRSKADQSGAAYLWLPAGAQVLQADNYPDTGTTITTDNLSTAVLNRQTVVTAHNSTELQTYMAASYVSTINLVNTPGTPYEYLGGTISRNLTINGNGAEIVAGTGVSDTVIRCDGITVDLALGNYTDVKTFLKVEGPGSSLILNDVTLRNGENKNGTDEANDGLFTVINVKTGGSLELNNVTLKAFHNNPVPGNNLSFGIHAEPGAVSTTIKNSKFESSNAFRNAIAIRSGAMLVSSNTFQGTDYPAKLRQSDGYEYAMYIYGGNGTISGNTITGYDSTTQLGYASAGISVIGFYSTEVIIENNSLAYNESGIDITGTWTPWSINTNMKVNGLQLTSSEDAYIIGEALKAANTQDYVSVSHNQNDEVQLETSGGQKYFSVLGGYRSPWITVASNVGSVVTVQFPLTDIDALTTAAPFEFELQMDGGTSWSAITPTWVQPTEAKLTLQPGHEYRIRAKLTHKSYVESGDPVERTLITYSNSISVTMASAPAAPTATTGDECIDVTNVAAGAQLKLYAVEGGQLVTTTYKDMGNGTYRFENILPRPQGYYVIQTVDGLDSLNTPFLNSRFRTPVATGGEGYVDVTNVSSGSTIRLYKIINQITTLVSEAPTNMGDGTYRFENVIPERAEYYVIQYANTLESSNSVFVGVRLPTPSIVGGNRQITVSNVYSGATLILYAFDGTEIKRENSVTTGTYHFNNVTPGVGYYIQQTINGVVSQASNLVTVYSSAPKFVGGSLNTTVRQYPNTTDLRDQLYVSDLDVGQTLTWSVIDGPNHGTLTGFPVTASTNGAGGINGTVGSTDIRIPTAVTYMPDDSYVGNDTFTIQVSDGIATDTRVINVSVNATLGSKVTANNSADLEEAINNSNIATINLKSGTTYQVMGAEINRSLTINGNGAVIEVLGGVGQSFDNQTIYHLGMRDANGNRRYRGNLFWYVKEGGSLKVENLTLRNAATSENEQGLTGVFAAILLNDAASLSLKGVSFNNFWFKNSKFEEQNNLSVAQGLYSSYSDLSYGVYSDFNCSGDISISNSTFGNSNAFREAIHIYNGNNVSVENCTLKGTDHPDRLRESDRFEYGMYLYGGTCSVKNNSISGYDSKKNTDYSSAGIALLPYYNLSAVIDGNTIQGNDTGLDITGGWDALNPAPAVDINNIQLSTEDKGFSIGEGLKASNTISESTGANIYIKLDQNDDSNAFVYYSPFLSISNTNTTKPTLNFSQASDAVELSNSAITFEVQKSEDNGQSWTPASVEGTINSNSTSVVVNLEANKAYALRLKMTHNNNQTPNTIITGYSDAVTFAALSSEAGIANILSKPITAGTEAGTRVEPKTVSISVENSVAAIALGDIVKSEAGATVTFYGTDNTFSTAATGSVNLAPGAVTEVYIKVVAAAGTTLHYKVSVNRAASTMNVTGVKVTAFNGNQIPSQATIEVAMDDIGLSTGAFTMSNVTAPGTTVTVNNATYSDGKYILSVSGMTYYDNYSLAIAKTGYTSYTNSSFYGELATGGELDLVNEPNIFPTYSRALTSNGIVTISNSNYAANDRLYSGPVYTAIDSNNGNPDNGTTTRLIGIFVKAPEGVKGVKTLKLNGLMGKVAEDSLIDSNPNYQETVASGKEANHNDYWKTIAFLPLYTQIASERQSDNSRILIDPADRFRIIEWYDNEECTGEPIQVTRLMVMVEYTGSPISTDAGLTSVLGQTIVAGNESGTSGTPKTASINVANTITTVSAQDIVNHDAGATMTFYGTDSTFTTAEAGSVNLEPGAATNIYAKVVAVNGLTLYYKVIINRTGSSNTGITSILGQTITAGPEAGTIGTPKTASINVANATSSIAASDIVKSHAGATVTFYGTDSKFVTQASGSVALVSGGDTTVYIKITAQDASAVIYYAVTIKRAALSNTPDPTPGPGPIVTPTPTPVADKVERITVDVKQGATDNTISKIDIERTTHIDGSKSDAVTYKEEKARETIEKLKEEGKDVARILIPGADGGVSRTQVTIPSTSLNTLSEGEVKLQIDTEDVKIEIPKASLAQANQKLEEDLFFKLVPIKEEEQKLEVTQRVIFEVGVISNNENTNISALGTPMTIETNMPSTDVDITLPLSGISIPVDPVEREAFLGQLAVFIEHSDGEKELVQGEIVEYRPGVLGIKFHITKFSTFTIVKTEKSSACDVIKVIVPAKATIKGSKITSTVDNATKSLTVKVTVSDKASWKMYSDKECSKELKDRKLSLKAGTNTVYLKTTAEDGKTSRIYTIIITRKELPKQLIIIANKYDFADAFVGGVPALQSGGEVITTGITPEDAKKLVSYIKKNYTKQDKIYILGLEEAVNKDLEMLLNKEGYTDIVRLGGKDKYETAKKTAGLVKLSEKVRVVLVNGTVKPEDAESIQKICADKGYPILLVQKNNLTTSTLEALKEIKPVRVYILGDQTKISSKVEEQVGKALKLKSNNIIRIKSGNEIK